MIGILMAYLWEKCEKIFGKIYAEYSKKFWEKNNRDLHFLCHLVWPRWFNFLVHDLIV